jgi:HAD superfamily hydrolase (TIGR01509 family)
MPAEQSSPRSAVFLDALGTLVRLEEPWPRLVDALRDDHAVTIELADARRAMLTEMAYYRANCIRASNATALHELRVECAEILRAELAPRLDAISPEDTVATLLKALLFKPYDDVRSALERWRAAGKRTIVVSNWDISLHDVLAATGLRTLLDGVVCSAEVGVSKPDPAIFRRALELAGVAAEDAVHIGDSLDEDVAGAHAAGIEAILLRRTPDDPPVPSGVTAVASLREC